MLKKIFPLAVLSVVLLCVYGPVYIVSYAHHDSYGYLEYLPNSHPFFVFHQFLIFLGRYLGAWILTFYGWFVNDMPDLKVINFLTVLQCVFSAWLVMRLLYRRFDPFKSLCITLMIFTLPPFQVMASFTTATSHMTAVLLALLAVFFAYKSHVFENERIKISQMVLPVILLFASLCVYSSNAMFYWAVAGLIIFLIEPENIFKLKQKIGVFVIGFTAIGAYAVTVKTVNFFMGTFAFRNYSPVKINTDIVDRAQWFINEPLTNAVNLWNVFPSMLSTTLMYLIFLSLGALVGVHVMREQKDRGEVIRRVGIIYALAGALVLLSYFPNLIALEKAPYYRCSAGLSAMILVLFIFFVKRSLPTQVLQKASRPLLLTGALISCIFCFSNILYARVIPSYLEFNYLKSSLVSALERHDEHVHIIRPRWDTSDGRYDEFLTPTSHWSENILPMVIAVFKEWGNENGLRLIDMPFDNQNGMAVFIFEGRNGEKFKLSVGISSALPGVKMPEHSNMAVVDLDRFLNVSGIYK